MARKKHKRRELLVSLELQLGLAARVVVWMCAYIAIFAVALNAGSLYRITTGEATAEECERVTAVMSAPLDHPAAALAMAFLVWLHLIVYFHRLAGPAYRFKQTVRQMAKRQPPERVNLRTHDFMSDVAEELDRYLAVQREERARLRRLNGQVLSSATRLLERLSRVQVDQAQCAALARNVRECAERLEGQLCEQRDDVVDAELIGQDILPRSAAPVS